MEWFAAPDGRPGRPLRFSDRAIEFCLTLKGLFQLPLRQVTGLARSLLRLAGLDWPVPDYTTLCRRQKSLWVALGGRPNADGLHLLVDSTGIKMMGEGEWKTRKHGVSYRRQWRKVHIGIDAETFDIRAIEVTSIAVGDGQTLPDLLAQIPADETMLPSAATVPMTPEAATQPSMRAVPSRSSLFAATARPGPRTAPASRPATRRFVR